MTKPISIRLDDDALRALRRLEAAGFSRSDAIRKALVDTAARHRDRQALRAEVQALKADAEDRRESTQVANLMATLRAPR